LLIQVKKEPSRNKDALLQYQALESCLHWT